MAEPRDITYHGYAVGDGVWKTVDDEVDQDEVSHVRINSLGEIVYSLFNDIGWFEIGELYPTAAAARQALEGIAK